MKKCDIGEKFRFWFFSIFGIFGDFNRAYQRWRNLKARKLKCITLYGAIPPLIQSNGDYVKIFYCELNFIDCRFKWKLTMTKIGVCLKLDPQGKAEWLITIDKSLRTIRFTKAEKNQSERSFFTFTWHFSEKLHLFQIRESYIMSHRL